MIELKTMGASPQPETIPRGLALARRRRPRQGAPALVEQVWSSRLHSGRDFTKLVSWT
jgi:hypothetical protein